MQETRDEELYLKNGDIILSAEDGPGKITYFRVHRAKLVSNCAVFRDILSIPTPAVNDSETYDGAPLVALHDPVEHLRSFLHALYDCELPGKGILSPQASPRFSSPQTLIGPFLLAKKYQADILQLLIISRHLGDWPSRAFDIWLERTRASEVTKTDPFPHPEELIHFTRITDTRNRLSESLAVAYYQLLCKPIDHYDLNLLEKSDLLLLMQGRARLNDHSEAYIGRRLDGTMDCLRSGCDFTRFCESLLYCVVSSRDPMTSIRITRESAQLTGSKGLCSNCRPGAVDFCREFMQELYQNLPRFFNLDGC